MVSKNNIYNNEYHYRIKLMAKSSLSRYRFVIHAISFAINTNFIFSEMKLFQLIQERET
jgi:hypothetical protein